jgi:ribosomal protein S18 acetylase RimI-like enzyme
MPPGRLERRGRFLVVEGPGTAFAGGHSLAVEAPAGRRDRPGYFREHVWVHPGARRLGLARRLLGELEREAAGRGFGVVRLDTHASLTEAQAMYRACGYTEIPRYNDDVYGAHFFEKRLTTPRRR